METGLEAWNFEVAFSDGSVYTGRIYADTMAEAMAQLMKDMPTFPGNPVPVTLSMIMKGMGGRG